MLRTVDYLETRDEIDADALAYYGFSWGAGVGPIPLALEPRLKVAILEVAGLGARVQPEIDPLFFLPRTSVPVLMLSGRLDAGGPTRDQRSSLLRLTRYPGRAEAPCRFRGGHFVPMTEVIRESLDFLDRYLGPVGSG